MICILTGSAIFGQEKEFSLTVESLTSRKFISDPDTCFTSGLTFRGDGTYVLQGGCQAGWQDIGTYRIADRKLDLYPEHCSNMVLLSESCESNLGRASCSFELLTNDLYHAYGLVCRQDHKHGSGDFVFPLNETVVSAGAKRVHNGVTVVTLGMLKGRTTNAVNIRRSPSANAQIVPYHAQLLPSPGDPFVPKDTAVVVIARTERKEQVKAWNNYWYLVNVGRNQEVWMFAEFVKLEQIDAIRLPLYDIHPADP